MFEYEMRMKVKYRSDKHIRLHEGTFESPQEAAFKIARWMYEYKYRMDLLVSSREPPELIAWILPGVVCHRLEMFILPGLKEIWAETDDELDKLIAEE